MKKKGVIQKSTLHGLLLIMHSDLPKTDDEKYAAYSVHGNSRHGEIIAISFGFGQGHLYNKVGKESNNEYCSLIKIGTVAKSVIHELNLI